MDFISQEIAAQLASFKRRRTRDKRKSFSLQLGTVMLSAIATVLLGIDDGNDGSSVLRNVALALTASVTVLAAAESFFSHRDLWVLRTRTVRRLEMLDLRRRHYVASPRSADENRRAAQEFVGELQVILEEDRIGWQAIRDRQSLGGESATENAKAS